MGDDERDGVFFRIAGVFSVLRRRVHGQDDDLGVSFRAHEVRVERREPPARGDLAPAVGVPRGGVPAGVPQQRVRGGAGGEGWGWFTACREN